MCDPDYAVNIVHQLPFDSPAFLFQTMSLGLTNLLCCSILKRLFKAEMRSAKVVMPSGIIVSISVSRQYTIHRAMLPPNIHHLCRGPSHYYWPCKKTVPGMPSGCSYHCMAANGTERVTWVRVWHAGPGEAAVELHLFNPCTRSHARGSPLSPP